MKNTNRKCEESDTKIHKGAKTQSEKKVTAVIPVKKTSTRCENKNIRTFSDSSLLKLKINTLKKVKNLDHIIVSSDDDFILEIAENMNVGIHKREAQFCTNDNVVSFLLT